jgi:glucose-6-phosphate isomerase
MDFTQTSVFSQLQTACKNLEKSTIASLFALDSNRFQNFSRSFDKLVLDFSKQKISQEVFALLLQLAQELDLQSAIMQLYNGEIVNASENRAALHMQLRSLEAPVSMQQQLIKVKNFVETNKFKDVIHIGIGGSDLGPQMVVQALQTFAVDNAPKIHFIANTDADHLYALLQQLNPQQCLCIISSKSFTTIETLTLANKILAWYRATLDEDAVKERLIAVTANSHRALEFGIANHNIFSLWDSIGGRYSVWSAIGLPIALTIGYEQFREFLHGAQALDQHFISAPCAENLPVIMALIGILNINFYQYHTHCVIPYTDALQMLPNYLQQLEMESNGKQASFNTAPIVWGSVGCNSQHAFMQLLHQGTITAPIDFILPLKSHHHDQQLQDILISSCLAQSRALLTGVNQELNYKNCAGDKPSTTLLCEYLNPYTLGQLLALYEHKVFVQGILWGINSFDQWGVQLGKIINEQLLAMIKQQSFSSTDLDASTSGLLAQIYNKKVT